MTSRDAAVAAGRLANVRDFVLGCSPRNFGVSGALTLAPAEPGAPRERRGGRGNFALHVRWKINREKETHRPPGGSVSAPERKPRGSISTTAYPRRHHDLLQTVAFESLRPFRKLRE
jgi:hypothetical protein